MEILSAIVRVGPRTRKYGDPFDFSVAVASCDGHTGVIKALTRPADHTQEPDFEMPHTRAIIKAVRSMGLVPDWKRFKAPRPKK